MTRFPRRTVPALLTGLVLLGLSALVAVSCVQLIAGDPPLLPFTALHRAAAALTLADAPALGVSALLAVLGVVLLGCAVLPGTPDVLPLAARSGGAAAGVARHGLAWPRCGGSSPRPSASPPAAPGNSPTTRAPGRRCSPLRMLPPRSPRSCRAGPGCGRQRRG